MVKSYQYMGTGMSAHVFMGAGIYKSVIKQKQITIPKDRNTIGNSCINSIDCRHHVLMSR